MKWMTLTVALVVSAVSANSADAGLGWLKHKSGCCNSAPTCSAPAPIACKPTCSAPVHCAPKCSAPAPVVCNPQPCCKKRHHSGDLFKKFRKLFKKRHHHGSCCAPAPVCAVPAPVCIKPTCCAPAPAPVCIKPTCCAPSPVCGG